MGTKRIPTVNIYTDAAESALMITLTGDAAETFISQAGYANEGGVAKFFSYTDEEGTIHHIRFGCICAWTLTYETEEVEDRPCVLYQCLPITPPEAPTGA